MPMNSTERTILDSLGNPFEILCEDEICGECCHEDEESGCCTIFGGRRRHAPEQERYRLVDCKNAEKAALAYRLPKAQKRGRK